MNKSEQIAAAFQAGKPVDDAVKKAVREAVFGRKRVPRKKLQGKSTRPKT